MSEDSLENKIVEARLKLRERFLRKGQAPPNNDPLGSGPLNRHGMPTVPIGQKVVKKWPVLDLGKQPSIPLGEWRLQLDGACRKPLTLTWEQFTELPQTEDTSDFHCVTTWSKLDMRWEGVQFADLAALVEPTEGATHVLCYGYDGYTTNLPLEEALKTDVLLVHTVDGQPLPREHGGPVRMITPQLYAWKGSKWIRRIEFLEGDKPGYWERNGYSNTAHPWREDRYSETAWGSPGRELVGWVGAVFARLTIWLGITFLITCLALWGARAAGWAAYSHAVVNLSSVLALGSIPYALLNPTRRKGQSSA